MRIRFDGMRWIEYERMFSVCFNVDTEIEYISIRLYVRLFNIKGIKPHEIQTCFDKE